MAIAPMAVRTTSYRRVPVREAFNLANGHSPYSDLILAPGLTEDQLRWILSAVSSSVGVDVTRFSRIPVSSPLAQLIEKGLHSSHFRVGTQRELRTPLVRVQGTWADFLESRSQKFRKSMRNKLNRFSKAGGLTIERVHIDNSGSAVLSDLLEVSSRSWKAELGTDLARLPGSLAFLKELMDKLGPKGGVDVWIARSGTRAIAYELHMRHSGITYPLRADIDEEFRDLSPGSIVEYTALQDLFSEGDIRLYDSCANDYWYLSNWTTEHRDHMDIELFDRGIKGRSLHKLEYRFIPAARWLRDRFFPKPVAKGSTSSH